MPKTPMDEYDFAPTREHNVWFPRKIRTVQSIPETQAMNYGPNHQLRPSIGASNARHIAASLLRRENVSHGTMPIALG